MNDFPRLDIYYSKDSLKFLRENGRVITRERVDKFVLLAAKKILRRVDVNIDVIQLKGEPRGTFRIKTGKIRIILRFKAGAVYVAFVDLIVFRKDAYR
ncbi:MAG: hypothetical protein HQK60_09920 [Deltaproteobacteria bacterium]|nr:hypothetical protein [Deltaproteobacteria bacterium]